jgi:LPXTG-motif cell wall-anchored protein
MTIKSVMAGVLGVLALLLLAGRGNGTPIVQAQATLPPRPATATETLVPTTRPPAPTAVIPTETATLEPTPTVPAATAVEPATAVATLEPTAVASATPVPTMPVKLPDTGAHQSAPWELLVLALALVAAGAWFIRARRA